MCPFLQANIIVNAVSESAKKYYNFLVQNKAGFNDFTAEQIFKNNNEATLIENETWKEYICSVPSRMRIFQDSSATLIPANAPGTQIEIRIEEYDRRTGRLKLYSKDDILGTTAKIIIDFRWLVNRCLKWYQNNGKSIPEITKIGDINQNISYQYKGNQNISEEQRASIETMLSNGLSYIWGPPGTGKTNIVLLEAIRYCLAKEKKVLVLASTNLAVDNVLTGLLKNGIAKERLARIGIPSQEFLEKYPDCCEIRAFQKEIKNIMAQIKTIQDNINSAEKAKQINVRIDGNTRMLNDIESQIAIENMSLSNTKNDLDFKQNEKEQKEKEFNIVSGELDRNKHDPVILRFPQLLSEIDTLSSDQTQTIQDIHHLNKCLNKLGFFALLFTKRKKNLQETISRQNRHLESVETTLKEKRNKKEELKPVFERLKSEIEMLANSKKEIQNNIFNINNDISSSESLINDTRNNIQNLQNRAQGLKTRIEEDKNEIYRIRQNYHSENEEGLIIQWNNTIEELKKQQEKLKLDLSSKSVLGMTLDGFIGLTMQMKIQIDHVFIDEAPYAPLAKVIPLLSLHCPISMAGDHLQIPPICLCENDATIQAYWEKPAIFLEDAFRIGNDFNGLNSLENQSFEITKMTTLTKSYRFGSSLASLLERHIYHIGLEGFADYDTNIRCINCIPRIMPNDQDWDNYSEADSIIIAIQKWWEWAIHQEKIPTIAILTPYKDQSKLIYRKLKNIANDDMLEHIDVLNTHKAQGREWDWVLFSVVDTGNLPHIGTFLSDSSKHEGKPVINTTISRAKKHLVIFMDVNYWMHRRPESLLTKLANIEGCVGGQSPAF